MEMMEGGMGWRARGKKGGIWMPPSSFPIALHALFTVHSYSQGILWIGSSIVNQTRSLENTVSQIKPLSDLKSDQKGRIAVVQPTEPTDFQRLLRAGILPDTIIRVVDKTVRYGLYIVEHSVIALDRQTAAGIFVELV